MKLSINFALKSGKQDVAPVIAALNFGYKEFDPLKQVYVYKPLRYYTGITVEKNGWDSKRKVPFNEKLHAQLVNLEKKIRDIFNYLQLHGEITPDTLKAELDEKLKGKSDARITKRVRIVDFIHQEILSLTRIKENTKKSYIGLANKLIDFEKKIGKPLYSNEINDQVYLQFLEEMRKRLNRQNAVWKVMKILSATLREISRKFKIEVFSPAKELSAMDKVPAVQVDSIYLNFEHIEKIIAYTPKTESQANVKLILLTLLFTGCRESDVYKIKPEHRYEKNGESFLYAQYFSEKTDTEIIVPILKPLEEAFRLNDGNSAYPIAQQKFNKFVKQLIEDCGLTEEITISYTDAMGKKQFEKKAFYEFVSSHIGRRSFVTNLINHVPITTLTKITGHTLKDKSIIFGYNKISLLENAVLFREQLRYAMQKSPDYFPVPLV